MYTHKKLREKQKQRDIHKPVGSVSAVMEMLATSGARVICGTREEMTLRLAENDSIGSYSSSLIIGIEMRVKVWP